jgi:hypothetical protein
MNTVSHNLASVTNYQTITFIMNGSDWLKLLPTDVVIRLPIVGVDVDTNLIDRLVIHLLKNLG